MQYHHVSYQELEKFCQEVFKGYKFSDEEARQITEVLLAADLSGIESHGIQRLIRYHQEITGGLVKLGAKPEVVFETPLSAVVEGNDCMGQTLGVWAMNMAIEKAKAHGFGMITVRNSNHYGIAGYYSKMAAKEDLIGICMTNTEAILVPTRGPDSVLLRRGYYRRAAGKAGGLREAGQRFACGLGAGREGARQHGPGSGAEKYHREDGRRHSASGRLRGGDLGL